LALAVQLVTALWIIIVSLKIGSVGRVLLLAVMLAVGLAFSVTAFIVVRHLENARLEGAFQQRAGAIAASLKRSLDISLDDVYSLADFLTVSNDVDAAKFRSFVTPMLESGAAVAHLGAACDGIGAIGV